ncbi:hypothetical protein JQ628_11495 [Bradyrhizobium lablabi]|uniref:hypothetical protein n=1 Tax=Bradyrhizobium lablabi TaxID=722472 RepID=UPI001BAD026C|nr:hypothetical protein [Bradyrhizobium lablabi]MBR1122140.1 hypothetical protein [Bradyrhizobium lablabi]
MGDLGNMTYGIRANAADVCDVWMKDPMRRHEFGPREIHDIREAVFGLKALLDEYDRRNAPHVVYRR